MTITGNTFKPEFFFVSPMEVVKVSTENLNEVSEWCGGSVAETESRRVKGRMDKYVWVPTPKGTKISWAFPGMYISKRMVVTLKDELVVTYSVFRKDYFTKNYFGTPNEAVEATWERADRKDRKERIAAENKSRLANVTKKTNGAPLALIMGDMVDQVTANATKEDVVDVSHAEFTEATGIVLPEELSVKEAVDVIAKEKEHFLSTLPVEVLSDTDRTDIAGVPEENLGGLYDEGGRETPSSPLPEPREAEEHERITEEMEPASDVLEGDLTPDDTVAARVEAYRQQKVSS